MKYIKQLLIIMFISLLGEIAGMVLPFPIPSSVYGMVIMLAALMSGVVKVDMVEDTADFLLMVMPVMFIPPCVGLITVWDKVKGDMVAIAVIAIVSTVAVMAVTGLVAQAVMKRKEKKENE